MPEQVLSNVFSFHRDGIYKQQNQQIPPADFSSSWSPRLMDEYLEHWAAPQQALRTKFVCLGTEDIKVLFSSKHLLKAVSSRLTNKKCKGRICEGNEVNPLRAARCDDYSTPNHYHSVADLGIRMTKLGLQLGNSAWFNNAEHLSLNFAVPLGIPMQNLRASTLQFR
ncbi:hypothetical protein RRG08_022159 [Elysia crispata]|uniref:Uncharacterized protein n=1 Tax=Elysia crispata TaxID=231223 RepID=A0AAE1AIH7_9GAST|nr:hypothetical protein RRG08_022159 [Elysia crispata]